VPEGGGGDPHESTDALPQRVGRHRCRQRHARAAALVVDRPATEFDVVHIAKASQCQVGVEGLPWNDLYARFAAPDVDRRVAPDRGSKVTYEGLSAQLQERLKDLLAETPATR